MSKEIPILQTAVSISRCTFALERIHKTYKELMRSRIHYILLLLAGALLTVVSMTSCGHSPLEGSDEELTLLIRFSPIHPFRTVEDGATHDSYEVSTYKPITLFFYDENGNPTESYRVSLESDADIAQAMGDGYEVKVREAVHKVSAIANKAVNKSSDLDDLLIYKLQTLGGADQTTSSFLHSVPYVAPQAIITDHPTDAKKRIVTLQPVPNVARLEISGDVTIPLESQQQVADWIVSNKMIPYPQTNYSYVASSCELPIRYITDFTIRGIYLNNYKETPSVVDNTKRICLKSDDYNLADKVWTGHRSEMHTFFDALGGANPYASVMTAGKVDAYQIYPGADTDPEALDHIIVEVEYKMHTRVGHFDAMVYNKDKNDYVYACSRVETLPVQTLRRFITIRKFLVGEGAGEKSLVSFDAGKIYRIDLKYLSPLFSMNTNPGIKNTDDITEITPRRERTDERPEETSAAVYVDVSGWTHININTELD